jgi:2,4-dienoyl-CoA reductase-like NADH-dependent reductase (Old Yellow Enzyme family)
MADAGDQLQLGSSTLRNRLVGLPHASGLVRDGLPLPGDEDYWRRLAAGGVAMATIGGTIVAPESGYRGGNVVDASREEAIPGLRARAQAIQAGGAIAVQQLVHLGRETLGAPIWYAPVAPSPVRSPREPTAPRALSRSEVPNLVEAFVRSARNVAEAGYDGVEVHAAHGYLIAQFLSAETNLRDDEYGGDLRGRMRVLDEIVAGIRSLGSQLAVGVRLSLEPGLEIRALAEIAGTLGNRVDWISLTVGARGEYVRDMGTEAPPLLGGFGPVRDAADVPLIVGQAFRTREHIDRALAEGAGLVGIARPLIADPEFPHKTLEGRARSVRPCVSCNEDCRLFDPILLCTVGPDLGLPGEPRRRAAPIVLRDDGGDGPAVAVVGGGVAGLECALTLASAGHPVTVFEAAAELGGGVALAARAPHRTGWRRILDFYLAGLDDSDVDLRVGSPAPDLGAFDEIVLATGAEERLPELDGAERSRRSSDVIANGIRGAERVVVVDDGFGWWPCVSAVEVAVEAGAAVTVVSPSGTFAIGIPAESRTQLQARLTGARLHARSFVSVVAVESGAAVTRNLYSGEIERVPADLVVFVGKRHPVVPDLGWPARARVQLIGDAVVPRRVAHAIAEGRAAAEAILARNAASVSRDAAVPSSA